MFSNFLYFLCALILYTTCYYPEGVYTPPDHSLLYAFISILFFISLCRISFKRLLKKADFNKFKLDNAINAYITKFSIFALVIYSSDLYYFRLKLFLDDYKIFHIFPTLEAIIFLLIFLFYLIIIWDSAWICQKQFFPKSVKRQDYIISNISFSLPALIPWFLLSIIADFIQILPFKFLSDFLSNPVGEILYILIFLMFMAVFGPFLIKKMWRCKPLDQGHAREVINQLSIKTNFKYTDILKWDLFGGTMITAGIMGLWSKFRYLLVTPALIGLLDDKEIESVISHEIGHVKKKHLYFYIFFFIVYMVCVYFLFDPLMLLIYSSSFIYKSALYFDISHDSINSIVFSLVLISVFLLYFRYVFGYFMRNFERQADAFVFSIMGDVKGLISTFKKIVTYSGQSPDKPNWHHFNISERINFLQQCEIDNSKIKIHDKKILKMMMGFIFIFIVICIAGYSMNYGKLSKYLNKYIAQNVLNQGFRITRDNYRLYEMLGDYSYNIQNYADAELAWQNTLKLDPDNLHALNNLAWLYATCEDVKFINKYKAYKLSLKAVKIDRAAFILDTYAEACFLNGYCKRAISASQEALSISDKKKKEYYKNQYLKFKQKCGN